MKTNLYCIAGVTVGFTIWSVLAYYCPLLWLPVMIVGVALLANHGRSNP